MTKFLVIFVNDKKEAIEEIKKVAKKHRVFTTEALIAESIDKENLDAVADRELTEDEAQTIYDYWMTKYELVSEDDVRFLMYSALGKDDEYDEEDDDYEDDDYEYDEEDEIEDMEEV